MINIRKIRGIYVPQKTQLYSIYVLPNCGIPFFEGTVRRYQSNAIAKYSMVEELQEVTFECPSKHIEG